MIYDKADKVMQEFFESLLNRYQLDLRHQWEVVGLYLIVLISCITNPVI